MGEATREARQQIAAARGELSREVDDLALAARSAVDIPAKIRRNPGKTAALGAGAVVRAAKGPQRVARRVANAVTGRRRKPAPVERLLHDEVERILGGLGEQGDALRASLEHGFADYLERGSKARKKSKEKRTSREALWHVFDSAAAPIAARAAKQYAERLFAAEPDRSRAPDPPEAGSSAQPKPGPRT